MWNCPVCSRMNDTPFCPVCGFDRSADAERFPTFSPLSRTVASAAGARRERSGLVVCPDCGGTGFCLERASGLARCRVCGRVTRAGRTNKAITAIAAGDAHTIALYSDGTVRAVGKNKQGQCNTRAWRDIVAIAGGFQCSIGLRSDGTVVAVGNNHSGKSMVHTLTGIRSICTCKGNHSLFLRSDGTVAALGKNDDGECNVEIWRDIVSVAAGAPFSLGLKKDGTVTAIGKNDDGRCDTGAWRDITAISTGSWHALGLKKDGTAVCAGKDVARARVGQWRDLVQLCGGDNFSAGLRRDGRLCLAASGKNSYRLAEGWSDITAIAAGDSHLVGLRADGTLLAAGENEDDQCNVDLLQPEPGL